MNEPRADFDLKLMPDWLKEAPAKNPYANYEVRESDRPRFGESRGRGGDSQRPRGRGPGGDRGRGNDPRVKRDEPKRDQIRGKQQGFRDARGSGGPWRDQEAPRPQTASTQQPPQPSPVRIEFLPDPNCVSSIAKQIRATNRAYSLFDLARMFLAKPERHRVRITSNEKSVPIFQAGENGPVSLDRASLERAAFAALQSKFYAEETIQRDPPKGNFSNVARHRLTGTLLGPTNYHGYQPALRKLYDERFSRRMSFPDFQREIQTVSDPGLIEQWKDQVRTSTVYREIPAGVPAPESAATTVENESAILSVEPRAGVAPQPQQTEEAPLSENAPAVTELETPASLEAPASPEPEAAATPQQTPVFETLAEVEQHFRTHHLESVLRSAQSIVVPGEASRSVPDRRIAAAVREGWENETGFPGQMMHHLRVGFTQAGLHVWKHRKRMQFVSAVRPAPFTAKTEQNFSPTVAEILRLVETTRGCTRAKLGTAMLGSTSETDPEFPKRKTALATDLRWLIDTGRVIEFYDGKLELPLSPKDESKPAGENKGLAAATAPAEIEPAAEILPSAPSETAPAETAAAPDDAPISQTSSVTTPPEAEPPGEPPAIISPAPPSEEP